VMHRRQEWCILRWLASKELDKANMEVVMNVGSRWKTKADIYFVDDFHHLIRSVEAQT
jgi:hypothetical protein